MVRRAAPGHAVSVPRGFPPYDPTGLRLFGDRGKPLLSNSLLRILGEDHRLLLGLARPLTRKGEELPGVQVRDLLSDVVGGRHLKSANPHATVDRAFEEINWGIAGTAVEERLQDERFVVPEAVHADELFLRNLPMSGQLRGVWDQLLGDPEATVADTVDVSRRVVRHSGGGWAAVAEWAVLLEHFCVDAESFGLFQDAQTALKLDLVADLVAEELRRADGNRLDGAWVELLRRRKGWGRERATLDTVGHELGVTRERVRQIEARLFEYSGIRVWPLPKVLGEALEVALDSDVSSEEFGVTLVRSGITVGPEWDREAVADLCTALGRLEDAEAVRDSAEAAEIRAAEVRQENQEVLARIRQARSHMGFVRLDAVDDGSGSPLPVAQVRDRLIAAFPRVAFVRGWALAGVQRATAAENAALDQLAVADALPSSVIVEGLDRVARKRLDLALPPADIVIDLLSEIGCVTVEDGMVSPLITSELPDVGSNDRWLHDLLFNHPGQSMHVEDVLRAARASGRNEASISVHVTYSPIVRRVGGIVSLVGSELDPAERASIKRAADAKRVPSDYTIAWTEDGPVLTLTMGTAYLTSTVVGMRQDLLSSVRVEGLGTTCCSAYDSDARLGISGPNAVYGWTTLFRHWVSAHGISEGDRVRVLVGDEVVSTLEPWAQVERESGVVGVVPSAHTGAAVEPQLTLPVPDQVAIPGPAAIPVGTAATQSPAALVDLPGALPTEPIRDMPAPGTPSPRPRGEERLTLSAAREDLVVGRDGSSLTARFGSAANELARAWLRIRPTGGRVWVDADGAATTLVGDQLTYLGQVPVEWLSEHK